MTSFIQQIPAGDNRERLVCADCGFVAYENPKVVAGSVIVADDRVLMCRRAIEPRKGFWTLPAGYMELGETLEEGAAREALEEAEAVITIDGILGRVQHCPDRPGPGDLPGPLQRRRDAGVWCRAREP